MKKKLLRTKNSESAMDVILQWIGLIDKEIEGGWLSIDYGAIPVVIMKTEAYNLHICDGEFKAPNDSYAHAYFKALRLWINYRRAYWNGQNQLPEDSKNRLSALGEEDAVTFGVEDGEGNVYLLGRETNKTFHIEVARTTDGK